MAARMPIITLAIGVFVIIWSQETNIEEPGPTLILIAGIIISIGGIFRIIWAYKKTKKLN